MNSMLEKTWQASAGVTEHLKDLKSQWCEKSLGVGGSYFIPVILGDAEQVDSLFSLQRLLERQSGGCLLLCVDRDGFAEKIIHAGVASEKVLSLPITRQEDEIDEEAVLQRISEIIEKDAENIYLVPMVAPQVMLLNLFGCALWLLDGNVNAAQRLYLKLKFYLKHLQSREFHIIETANDCEADNGAFTRLQKAVEIFLKVEISRIGCIGGPDGQNLSDELLSLVNTARLIELKRVKLSSRSYA